MTQYGHPLWLHGHICAVAKRVVGIDLDVQGIKMLREKGFNVVYGNAENFNLGSQFDVIIAGEVIEHLDNPGIFLENVRRHLRDEGILIITTPNVHSAYLFAAVMLNRADEETTHTHYHTFGTLKFLLKKYGFEIIRLERVPTELMPSKLSRLIHYFLPSRFQHTLFAVAKKSKVNGVG
jgi:SAM-dependent methyltransferase